MGGGGVKDQACQDLRPDTAGGVRSVHMRVHVCVHAGEPGRRAACGDAVIFQET